MKDIRVFCGALFCMIALLVSQQDSESATIVFWLALAGACVVLYSCTRHRVE